MKKVLLILVLSWALALSAQEMLTAKIYDGITFVPIEAANIYNLTAQKYAFSDKNGTFSIPISLGDTLIISKSIYRQLLVAVDKKMINSKNEHFLLYYKAILLKEVNIYAINPNYEGFKRDIVNLKLPDLYGDVGNIRPTKMDIANAEYGTNPNVLKNTAIGSPITFLYNAFSKKAKMKALYEEMVNYGDEVDKVQTKYNRALVTEITGLQGADLMEFMVFCRFSYYDLVRWSQEEIVHRIKFKFDEYEYYKVISD